MGQKYYINKLKELDEQMAAINYSMGLISWDGETTAPKKSVNARANALKNLSTTYYTTFINDETNTILSALEENSEGLTKEEKALVRIYRDEYDRIAKIPKDEYAKYSEARSKATVAWEQAKHTSDFSIFAPHLKKMIDLTKKQVDYFEKEGPRYNVLLDMFEKGLTMEKVEAFFSYLKAEIVPLVRRINQSKIKLNNELLRREYSIEQQRKLSKDLMVFLGFDLERGIIAESEHPFTATMCRDDIRFSTHYYENDLKSGILSTVHETGHAVYEQNIDEKLGYGILSNGTSMGIHESQSRFYENHIGLNKAFWKYYYGKLQAYFKEELAHIDVEEFYKSMNVVSSSLIRTEADEVTYPLHIMIRYEMEKYIFDNDVDVYALPAMWNEKYKEYLGIEPDNDANGILQDVHWAEGLFGYFPSYALGSAYSAQFLHAMNKDINVEECLINGDMKPIFNWLCENIHCHGSVKIPDEIMLDATGEAFNPKYFVDYLVDKYTRIYNL